MQILLPANCFTNCACRHVVLGLLVVFALFLSIDLLAATKIQTQVVAIAQIVEHPSLNRIRAGIVDTMKSARGEKNIEIKFYNAQGNMTIAAQIAHKIASDQPALAIAISTPMSQALVGRRASFPVLFSAVNDPIQARLIGSNGQPNQQVTGVTYNNPIEQQIGIMQQVLPTAKRVGVLYNASEINSVNDVARLRIVLKKSGLTLITSTISNSSQVLASARSLVDRVDVIYLPLDNTVVSAVASVVQTSLKRKIPIFASDPDSVREGALISLTLDQYHLGTETGLMALEILAGKKPKDLPIRTPARTELIWNRATAQALGIALPAGLKNRIKYAAKP